MGRIETEPLIARNRGNDERNHAVAACFGLLSSSAALMIGASGAVFGPNGLLQVLDYRMRRRAGLSLQPSIS
jgi:membrane associated rhomboid family serine protease